MTNLKQTLVSLAADKIHADAQERFTRTCANVATNFRDPSYAVSGALELIRSGVEFSNARAAADAYRWDIVSDGNYDATRSMAATRQLHAQNLDYLIAELTKLREAVVDGEVVDRAYAAVKRALRSTMDKASEAQDELDSIRRRNGGE